MSLYTKQAALDYHSDVRPGKLEVLPIKPCRDQRDLCLAYTPGVADACLAIKDEPETSYSYTGRGNLVAVVSNGTAVLGLGNIGPAASKPVMEGKGVLFKTFADVDVFDIELAVTDPDALCDIVKAMEPTFGGINLEDIKSPECFYIEERLKREMNIPVFHDDQHGTAILSAAGLMNGLEIAGRKIENVRIVVLGAGAAAIASARLYRSMGVAPENIAMFDSKGHINLGRSDLTKEKKEFATRHAFASLGEALKDADMLLGCSAPNTVTQDMVKGMAKTPVIFACANPVSEISYTAVKEVRPDAIMGTGRSDTPNQVNNVLGFPFIFRGALDVQARTINDEMKLAAAKAIADLAKEPVPDYVSEAFGGKKFEYGPEYILPKALDRRLIERVSLAVAKAAIDTGVARRKINLETYPSELKARIEASQARTELVLKSYGW